MPYTNTHEEPMRTMSLAVAAIALVATTHTSSGTARRRSRRAAGSRRRTAGRNDAVRGDRGLTHRRAEGSGQVASATRTSPRTSRRSTVCARSWKRRRAAREAGKTPEEMRAIMEQGKADQRRASRRRERNSPSRDQAAHAIADRRGMHSTGARRTDDDGWASRRAAAAAGTLRARRA